MASLDTNLRTILERAITEARNEAEKAAGVALDVLAVDQLRSLQTMNKDQRSLRNALRERGRQLGSGDLSAGIPLLIEEVAYAQWHRMLFARFLAENGLLIHPSENVPVTMEDCEELARQEGDPNQWMTAARYASRMLPGIFRHEDPSVNLEFTPEGRQALEGALASIPQPVFTSDDGIGWVYQFWQSKKKKEVSASGNKIEKLDLAAYSQLFTEDYMVRFLLENSLGAWWASRHPDSPIVERFQYLRYREDGTPASGIFREWPDTAAEITVMDPCCGSGHFLVTAFDMLRQMRMEEERLTAREAGDAVIRENLFGLEIDPRCVQIAAFAIALAAWKAGVYRELPPMNIACSGIPVRGQLEAWKKLANGDDRTERTLEWLHGLFVNAPDLGSLIDPMRVPVREPLLSADFSSVAPLLEGALAKEKGSDPVAAVFGNAALGVTRATELMDHQYTLVATNVPYLVRGKQGEVLREYLGQVYPDSKENLATVFLERCRSLTLPQGMYALVAPQNWLFLQRQRRIRQRALEEQTWNLLVRLGDGAFGTISGAVVNVCLGIFENSPPSETHRLVVMDASDEKSPNQKAECLLSSALLEIEQRALRANPDAVVSFSPIVRDQVLGQVAFVRGGITTGDSPRFRRFFWELTLPSADWTPEQLTVSSVTPYGGRQCVLLWENGTGTLATKARDGKATIAGREAWGQRGVAISYTHGLATTIYTGEIFENVICVAVPRNASDLPALWAFCSSSQFPVKVRQINQKLSVDVRYFEKVPFDLSHWQKVAAEADPIPEPSSEDPTQWLFEGNPANTTTPLQTAVARLMGYHWPKQGEDRLSAFGSAEGIICLVPVAGQELAPERLRSVLAAAYGDSWSAEQQTELLRQVGFGDKDLEAWLRDGFFEQHCKLFHQRPFIWQIWDGRKDGFSALVNYHKLDAANLNRLIYTYLGDWIRTQQAGEETGTAGASGRLVAALKLKKELEAIRDGEPSYDIHVRWKPLHEQPVGWDPDLNDGVRINIRPFATADVLRNKVKVKWGKDRGTNLDGSERINDLHLGTEEKLNAREAIKE